MGNQSKNRAPLTGSHGVDPEAVSHCPPSRSTTIPHFTVADYMCHSIYVTEPDKAHLTYLVGPDFPGNVILKHRKCFNTNIHLSIHPYLCHLLLLGSRHSCLHLTHFQFGCPWLKQKKGWLRSECLLFFLMSANSSFASHHFHPR